MAPTDPAVFVIPTTRRRVVATGAKLAYAAPLVAASMKLTSVGVGAVSGEPNCLAVGTCCPDPTTCRATCCSQTVFAGLPKCGGGFSCGQSGPGGACVSDADSSSNSDCVDRHCCAPTGWTVGGSVPTCAQCCAGVCNGTGVVCA